jgi:hypothetical protein
MSGLALMGVPLAAQAAHGTDTKPSSFTILFVGGAHGDAASPTLEQLEARLATLDPATGIVVFTGNYSGGPLPAESEPGRAQAEAAIRAHVDATAAFAKRGGRVYFLAGHEDYPETQTRTVRRLRQFLNAAYQGALGVDDDSAPDVMPQAGCGDLKLIELGKNAGLLLVDSQWWMGDWANDPQANQHCELKTRAELQLRLQDELRAYRGKRLIIASHHPLRSDGPLGGSFTASAQLDPLPVVGTLWTLARSTGLVPQYQNHPLFRSYVDMVFDEAQRAGTYVFASGHDASLQYLNAGAQVQIISGTSGRSAQPTVKPMAGDFARATPGWAELEVEASGAAKVSFFAPEAGPGSVFTTQLRPPVPRGAGAAPEAVPPLPPSPVYTNYTTSHVWRFGSVPKFFLGSFYSDAYQLKLPYDVLDLTTEQGGLRPTGTGGGLQTRSLKLKDAQGAEWVARAVTKDSSRVLPWPQNQATVLNRFLDHGYTATHPEAALIVPRLSEAVGTLHSEPRLMYLPDQDALGPYRGFIPNQLVLFERKPKKPKEGTLPETLAGPASEAGETTFKSTEQTLAKLMDKPATHRVDQEAMLRARLLDMLLGDWDRHQGQWSFAVIPNEDGAKTYVPVAKDRDQALANYDGLGLFLSRLVTPATRVLRPFDGHMGDIEWLNFNARDIDRVFLNQIPRDRWLAIAREEQAALTDAVIDEAMSTWHPEAYALDGARVTQALRMRRDQLVDTAQQFFWLINHEADVLGSNHDDTVDLWFMDRGAVRVTVRPRDKQGASSAPFFDRVFTPSQTEQLRIYALDGDDALVVHGDAYTSIDVRYVGGQGHDTVAAAPDSGRALSTPTLHVYDAPGGATIDRSIAVVDERSNRAELNAYDQFENHDPDFGTFLPSALANPDDGLFLAGVYSYTMQGYKKHPFQERHTIGAAFATATLAAQLNYSGLFPDSLWRFDQQVDLIAKSPTYTRNFFGITNHLVPDDVYRPDYFRVRQAQYVARYGLSYAFAGGRSRVGLQVVGQGLDTLDTPGRFVSVSPDVTPDALGMRFFGGARAYIETNTFDDLQLPKRGVALHASLEGRGDLEHGTDPSLTWRTGGALALPLDTARRVVFITRANVEGIAGPHPFYFAPTLGGVDLRAYHYQQLAGDVAFAQTTDLRVDVFRFATGLPSTVGFNLSLDHGRVFGPSIAAQDYHVDVGGGLWWSLLDWVGVQLGYFHGLDGGSRFTFTLGPLFSQTGF